MGHDDDEDHKTQRRVHNVGRSGGRSRPSIWRQVIALRDVQGTGRDKEQLVKLPIDVLKMNLKTLCEADHKD